MTTRLLLVVALLASAALVFNSCSRQRGGAAEDTTPPDANTVNEERDVTGFTRVVLALPGELEIVQNGAESVSVEAEEALLPNVRTRVQGNTLVIDTDAPNFSTNQPLRFTVYMYELTGLTVEGAGEVIAENLELETLELSIDGAGSAALSGEAQEVVVAIDGAGEVYARGLESNTVTLVLNGVGEVEACALESFNAEVNGAGGVRYYGDPDETEVSVNGAGDVERAGGCG